MAQVMLDDGDLNSLADRITAKVVEQLKVAGIEIHQVDPNAKWSTANDPQKLKPTDGRNGSNLTTQEA